jgi:hypothetical protein
MDANRKGRVNMPTDLTQVGNSGSTATVSSNGLGVVIFLLGIAVAFALFAPLVDPSASPTPVPEATFWAPG